MGKFDLTGNRGSGLLVFLTGMGTGITLAMLLAPRSGAATRRLIGHKVEEGEDWMKEKAAAAQEYVRDQGEALSGRIKHVAEAIGRA